MKKDEVKVGGTYKAKVSGKLTEVRITGESKYGGWDAVNVLTNKTVRIKSAQRLRGEALHGKSRKKASAPDKTSPKVVKAALAAAKAALAAGMAKGTKDAPKPPTAATGAPGKPKAAKDTTKHAKSATGAPGKTKMSGLDAAARVLKEAGTAMTTREMFDCVVAKGYWTSDAPTPHNTLYSAILREMQKKGQAARFRKAERGKFALKA